MTYNIPLMKQVYDQVTMHPETHDQCSFETTAEERKYRGLAEGECKTTRCIAGWALAITYPDAQNIGEQMLEHLRVFENHSLEDELDYAAAGADLLGLNPEEADDLFYELEDAEAVDILKWLIEDNS